LKTLGLIGGMSWESSALYYKIINESVKTHLGPMHSCKCILYSVDFAEIEHLQHLGEWDILGKKLADAAKALDRAGADLIVLCTNTMHKLSDHILNATSVPFLHIADATAVSIVSANIKKIGLLGTRFTMTESFYKERLIDKYGLDVYIPNEADVQVVHQVIYDELVQGIVNPESKKLYLDIIDRLRHQGVDGIILGCTEITMLVNQSDTAIPLFDTTRLHAEQAVVNLLALK
jgi:aspartate racemase